MGKEAKPQVPVHHGPMIAENDAAMPSDATAQPAESAEEIDTSLIEAHERLLRWAQSTARTLNERDAFAAYTASNWSTISSATADMSSSSRTATRMHRFVAEMLTDVKK